MEDEIDDRSEDSQTMSQMIARVCLSKSNILTSSRLIDELARSAHACRMASTARLNNT